MKCARPACDQEADPHNGKYCSKIHAPYAYLSDKEDATRSGKKIRKSISRAHTEAWVPFKGLGYKGVSREKYKEKRRMTGSVNPTQKTSNLNEPTEDRDIKPCMPAREPNSMQVEAKEGNKTMKLIEPDGMPGTDETKKTTTEKREPGDSKETHYMELPLSLIKSEQEKSRSMSLIDESTKLLQGFMQSLQKEKDQSPHHINAACNCAKQIHNLLRLKLDAIRVLK